MPVWLISEDFLVMTVESSFQGLGSFGYTGFQSFKFNVFASISTYLTSMIETIMVKVLISPLQSNNN